MPALSAQHLRKAFGPQVVLDDATFALARGEKVGLIGANGAGKSTLAKILAGLETPDGGTLSVRRGLSVRYLAQEPEIDADASARSVVEDALTAWREASSRHASVTAKLALETDPARHEALLAEQAELDESIVRLGGWERGHEALGFLDKLGVRDVDRPCGLRSGGERRRIALAQLLVASPDIAILDEPTNHLDADTAAWLEELLDRRFRGALVLVTHDRYFLDAVASRIVELERGKLVSYEGGYGDYLDKKAELLAHEERVEQNRKNALRREREWLARGPKARSTKQKARIQRAVALEAATPATAGRPGEVTLVTGSAPQQGKTVLELRGLQVAATAAARDAHALNAPFDLIVTAGERIGIVGPNGAGKTTLLRAILAAVEESRGGERPEDAPVLVAGSIVVGKNTRVAYLDQARAGLDDTKSIFDDVRGESGGTTVHLGVRGREAMDLRSYLELFLFDPNKQRQKVASLSGGERARVALAKMLRGEGNLLVLDEPTNDLDLPTLTALEGLLEDYEGSAIVVTHDRAFLDRIATAILAFEWDPGRAPGDREGVRDRVATVTRYAGGYQDYVTQRADRSEAKKAPAPVAAIAAPKPPPKDEAKRGLTYAERIELGGIVPAVDEADKRVHELEAELADPALYAKRGHDVADLKARLEGARAEAARLMARWEALEAKR
ncbi:MAG: ABC-F family ATP-binding cassette domain-containing protein [Polyangiaceae bacterium]